MLKAQPCGIKGSCKETLTRVRLTVRLLVMCNRSTASYFRSCWRRLARSGPIGWWSCSTASSAWTLSRSLSPCWVPYCPTCSQTPPTGTAWRTHLERLWPSKRSLILQCDGGSVFFWYLGSGINFHSPDDSSGCLCGALSALSRPTTKARSQLVNARGSEKILR